MKHKNPLPKLDLLEDLSWVSVKKLADGSWVVRSLRVEGDELVIQQLGQPNTKLHALAEFIKFAKNCVYER